MQLTFSEVLKREIQKLYSIEHHLLDALEMFAGMAQNPDLKQALVEHRKETALHAQRLDEICTKMGWHPVGIPSLTMEAMSKEVMLNLNGAEPSPLVDAMIIGAAQMSEHLEMASYGTARALAEQVGDHEAAELLGRTLEEEKRADQRLSEIALAGVNQHATYVS